MQWRARAGRIDDTSFEEDFRDTLCATFTGAQQFRDMTPCEFSALDQNIEDFF